MVKADTNDADYVRSIEPISDEDLEEIKPVIEAIKNCKENYNWPAHESSHRCPEEVYPNISADLIDKFNWYVPGGENGVHSIETIAIVNVEEILFGSEKLL